MRNRWPKSSWIQACISLTGALLSAVIVFIHTNESSFNRLAREFPHDGQDGLGAMMEAFSAGSATFLFSFLGLLLAQKLLTATQE